MIEYEKKVMLSEEEFNFLCKRMYTDGSFARQVNYYYDTDDYKMTGRGITCRIREKDGIYTVTMKSHRTGHKDCSREDVLGVSEIYDDSAFDKIGLKPQGILITERTVFKPGGGLEVAADKNIYLDTVDYEFEIEYPPEKSALAQKELKALSEALCVCGLIEKEEDFTERAGKAGGKAERFFLRKSNYMDKKE